MVKPPPNVRRHFLPWDRPLLPQAVEYLAGNWNGDGPLDLGNLLVVVPTRQAGRRLREALAAHAATRGRAVFSPRVLTPDALVAASSDEDGGTAGRLESLLAWTEVFRTVDLEQVREVFPVDPPERNFTWALRLAQDFVRLQGVLAEAGMRLTEVAARAGENFPEAERWGQIGELESRHSQALADLGLRDGAVAKIARAAAPVLAGGIARIVLLAVADPVPLALQALAVHAQRVTVEIVVFAPASESAAFDDWGRPEGAGWSGRELVLPDFERRVRLCADPAAQGERVASLANDYRDDEGVLAVGVADGDVLPSLETSLRRVKRESYNPEGRSRRGDALYQLLAALAGLVRDDSAAAVAALIRHPAFLEYLGSLGGGNFSAARFLEEFDRLMTLHLPPDLAEMRRQVPRLRELEAVADLRRTLMHGVFPENAATVLGAIFSGRRLERARPAEMAVIEAAEAWSLVTGEIRLAAGKFREVANAEWWDLALRLYGESVRFGEKAAGAVELQGWLELLWEDAPHLVVVGLNDGRVPEAVVGDPFLPESLRERLGLKTNTARFARDAYLLQALAQCRVAGGRLDLFLGKASGAGDPLRPSRLLLRCAEAELPRRVEFLFGAVEAGRVTPPWQRAWRLRPERVAPPTRLGVTSLRAWLDCPFRFYLSRVLKMQAVDPAKTELDELDFGILCHAALEAMGLNAALRDSTDAKAIREFLLGALDVEAARRYGRELTLPLIVQLESARQRLSRLAEVQAQVRGEGWVVVDVERKFELEIGGLTVVAKIDRIDRHEATGAIRVLDYKTSDKPVNPVEAHVRAVRRDEVPWEFAEFPDGERRMVWKDLQLPLYQRALAGEFPGEITCGYFNLPKASTETGIAVWEGYTRELAESAWRCAEGVALAIGEGKFWPPNEKVRADYDDFAALFHGGVAESVEWEGGQ